MKLEKFEMMRMQCLYEREVEFDLSETTVLPLRVSEFLEGVDVASKAGAWFVVDEVYRGAEVQGGTTPSFWGRLEKVVIASGLSKAFCLGGLRTGWVVAPQKLTEELRVRLDYLTVTPSLLSDHLGTSVMEPQRRESILGRSEALMRTLK